MIATEHKSSAKTIDGRTFKQSSDVEEIRSFKADVVIVCTTPARGKYWKDKLNLKDVFWILPHSPNAMFDELDKAVIIDFLPIIGGYVREDDNLRPSFGFKTNNVASNYYAECDEIIRKICNEDVSYKEFRRDLVTTNAMLHLCGLIGHLEGGEVRGKKFYAEMPESAISLMEEFSNEMLELFGENPVAHLRSKYANHDKGQSLGEFIRTNPPYQNELIVFPVNAEGKPNCEHRFFTEEVATFERLMAIKKMPVASKILARLKASFFI